MATIRTIIAMVAHYQWPIYQMDVKSAFLNGTLEEKVYVNQPPSFVDPHFPTKVCCLRKALYSLKQAPRAWNQHIDAFLQEQGFSRSMADHNLYIFYAVGLLTFLILYVNDLILTGSHGDHISTTKAALS